MPAALDTATRRDLLQRFEFVELFIELGWDYLRIPPIRIERDGHAYVVRPVAEKRGAQIFACSPGPDGRVPRYAVRRQIERELAKQAHEHLIIFADDEQAIWQWMSRELGRSAIPRETTFYKGHSGKLLLQQLDGIAIDVGEEETITLVDVVQRLKQTFDKDGVTKKFYEQFQKEHVVFAKFIEGIQKHAQDRQWYASLMLNRLMFVYFIQKQGFLDHGNPYYLTERLRLIQSEYGEGQFLTFYKRFLIRLFHQGLGTPPAARPADLDDLIGDVPYLNGGLFDIHELEERYPAVDVPDEAFERLFDFFEKWNWHLDTRREAEGDEINPDILGYIFEKYVNQKQMGAYYTKEDITEYITKNTIIPSLLDKAKEKLKERGKAYLFAPDGPIWKLLRENPDDYFYDAVTTGVNLSLPPGIEAGRRDVGKRDGWNRFADPEYALPNETWREHVVRRERYEEVWYKLIAGGVTEINDLITFNLDIRQFARDVIHTTEDRDLLKAFYEAVKSANVLDPTCGSGAFLFAAVNVLQPLYEECLNRMEEFVAKRDAAPNEFGPGTFNDFDKILAEVGKHGDNPTYFILKTIILNNLYGVDIEEQAVEICKLRLFLKLVAQLKPGQPIEPLPDIDFNIRAGNTLVGFATLDEAISVIESRIDWENTKERVKEEAKIIHSMSEQFRKQQQELGGIVTREDKAELRRRLESLEATLNRYMAADLYHIDEGSYLKDYADRFDAWRTSHQPFHWCVEFYGIMQCGGFDVIIGNPPYVEYSKVRNEYSVRGYETLKCGNLYSFVLERSFRLASRTGRTGLIVPLSLVCTSRMDELRAMVRRRVAWLSCFDMRPNSLFEGVAQRLCIVLASEDSGLSPSIYSAGYRRWASEERSMLMQTPCFVVESAPPALSAPISKFSFAVERSLLSKIDSPRLESYVDGAEEPIYVHRIVRYFIKALDFVPMFIDPSGKRGKSEDYKPFSFNCEQRQPILAMLNSTLFYWFWRSHSDGFHCGYGDVYYMPHKRPSDSVVLAELCDLGTQLMKSFEARSAEKTISTKSGVIRYQEFYPKHSKSIIDEIDRVLAKHYGFTDEELDFIINYDVKYRMGRDAEVMAESE